VKWLSGIFVVACFFWLPVGLSADSGSGSSLAEDLQIQIESLENIVTWSSELQTTIEQLQRKLDASATALELSGEELQKLRTLLEQQASRVEVLLTRSKNLLEISRRYKLESQIWKVTTIGFGATTLVFAGLWALGSL
jgi:DNA repair ATPase RecN